MDKKITLLENKTICHNRDSIFNYFAWPTVSRLPGGALAMVCSGFRLAHVCPFGKAVISYSFDDGETWTLPAPYIDTPFDDRDGGIAVFGDNRVIVTSFNNNLFTQTDALENYAIPQGRKDCDLRKAYIEMLAKMDVEEKYVGSTYKISDDGGFTFSELKYSPVMAPHGPCPLPNGELLYVGRKFYSHNNDVEGDKDIYCYKLNKYDEFEMVCTIKNNTGYDWEEPYAFAVSEEHIIVHIRVEQDGETHLSYIMQSESFDGGKTFSEARKIGLEHGMPSYIMRHSSGILVATYSYRKGAMGQHVMFSKDEGKTWDVDYVLTDDTNIWDLGYPSSVEMPDGSLLTVYYQYNEEAEACEIKQCRWNIPEEILKKF